MTNPNLSQRQRSQFNPLNLGRFSRTSLRLLTGVLGMKSQIIQGGVGNETYNHWFQVTLESPAWIILLKAGTALATSNVTQGSLRNNVDKRFMFGVYDQNKTPIEARSVIQTPPEYFGQVAGAQSDLYNTFNSERYDKGNELYYELEPGNYLICISATANEEFTYGVGLVVEFPQDDEAFILLEDLQLGYLLQENILDVPGGQPFVEIVSPVTVDITLDTTSAFTVGNAEVVSGIFVQVNNQNPTTGQELTWQIGPDVSGEIPDELNDRVLLDATPNWFLSVPPTFSKSEWRQAWRRDHQQDNRYPSGVFDPYANAE